MALTKQQLEDRKNWIGSSEATIIANGTHDQWFDLIQEKRGEKTKFFKKEEVFRMDAGSHMESFILDKAESDLALKTRHRGAGRTIDKDGVPVHSTFDAMAHNFVPVEAKAHFGFRDMDDLCVLYSAQCQHHMYAAERDHCFLVAFFGVHCRLEMRKINRDEQWLEQYIDNCKSFWDWYINDIPPLEYNPLPPVLYDDMITVNMADMEFFDSKMQSEMNSNALTIIQAKELEGHADLSKTEIKHYMPRNAKRMYLDLTGNHIKGSKIVVTRSRKGQLTCKVYQPKMEDVNV